MGLEVQDTDVDSDGARVIGGLAHPAYQMVEHGYDRVENGDDPHPMSELSAEMKRGFEWTYNGTVEKFPKGGQAGVAKTTDDDGVR